MPNPNRRKHVQSCRVISISSHRHTPPQSVLPDHPPPLLVHIPPLVPPLVLRVHFPLYIHLKDINIRPTQAKDHKAGEKKQLTSFMLNHSTRNATDGQTSRTSSQVLSNVAVLLLPLLVVFAALLIDTRWRAEGRAIARLRWIPWR